MTYTTMPTVYTSSFLACSSEVGLLVPLFSTTHPLTTFIAFSSSTVATATGTRPRPLSGVPAATNRADALPHTQSTLLTEIRTLRGTASRPIPVPQSVRRPGEATDKKRCQHVSWQHPRQTFRRLRQSRYGTGDRLQIQSSFKQFHRDCLKEL